MGNAAQPISADRDALEELLIEHVKEFGPVLDQEALHQPEPSALDRALLKACSLFGYVDLYAVWEKVHGTPWGDGL